MCHWLLERREREAASSASVLQEINIKTISDIQYQYIRI